MQTLKLILVTAFVCLLLVIWGIGGLFYYQASRPVSEDPRTIPVDISPGSALKQVSETLARNNVIRSPSAFRLLAYIQDKQDQIQAGEYELSPAMKPVQILNRITSGKTILHAVTVPEGYRITEIAALLEEKGMARREAFIQQTHDRDIIDSLGIPTDSLEGYLFPETYHFSKYTSERKILVAMVDMFKKQAVKKEFLRRTEELKFSFHEIITLASLIEKETGVDNERKLISAVFHNRLKKNMRLQTDPTVIYAIQNFDGNIRKKDLQIDSPYNTYVHRGLPPGPIASPGTASIVAALYPEDTNHLYFVSRQDGSHQFSTNLRDHNRAVQKYQLKKVNNVSRSR